MVPGGLVSATASLWDGFSRVRGTGSADEGGGRTRSCGPGARRGRGSEPYGWPLARNSLALASLGSAAGTPGSGSGAGRPPAPGGCAGARGGRLG